MSGATSSLDSLVGNDKPTKHTGPKGDFAAHRYNFLEQHLKEYYRKVQSVSTHSWWPILYSAYWSRFNWCNHTNNLLNQPIYDGLFSANDTISQDDHDTLSDCEKELKAKTMKAVNAMSWDIFHFLSDLTDLSNRNLRTGLPITGVNTSQRPPRSSLL